MSYLHCEFVYGVALIRNSYDSVVSPIDHIDFITGDASWGNTRDSFLDIGTTEGTTLNANAVATDDILTLVSTGAYTIGDKVAIELNNGRRHVTFIDDIADATDLQIVDPLPSDADSGNNFVSTDELGGTVSGTVTSDFKVVKAAQIFAKTNRLDREGFTYANVRFPLNGRMGHYLDGLNHRNEDYAERLREEDRASEDMTVFSVVRSDFRLYTFTSIGDYVSWNVARDNRIDDIYSNGTNGEWQLIREVTEADNTQVAMDAIVDDRT